MFIEELASEDIMIDTGTFKIFHCIRMKKMIKSIL